MRASPRTRWTSCAASWRWHPSPEAEALQRLRDLLQADGSLDELNALLCRRIAAGELGLHTPALLRHLWRVTLDKLAVDQPGYDSYRRHRAGIDTAG